MILVFVAEKKSERKKRKEKKKEAKNVRMIHFLSTMQDVDFKPQKTEEVACVAGPRKNGRARGRHARGEGGPVQKAHENRSTRIL